MPRPGACCVNSNDNMMRGGVLRPNPQSPFVVALKRCSSERRASQRARGRSRAFRLRSGGEFKEMDDPLEKAGAITYRAWGKSMGISRSELPRERKSRMRLLEKCEVSHLLSVLPL